jgi:hypothetical protein
MALKPLHAHEPFGEYDALDSELTVVKGGEVCSFTQVAFPGSDEYAADVGDGYFGVNTFKRPALTVTLVSGMRPLGLVDEGVDQYGTYLGRVSGGQVGKQINGALLGPHTATGSGKWTAWFQNGSYLVSLDAVDQHPTTGLQPTNTTIKQGDPLYATTAGLLTPDVGSAFEAVVVARFITFRTAGSLVKTPNSLKSAQNSPGGLSGGTQELAYAEILFRVEG